MTTDGFWLAILRSDLEGLGLGYTYAEALPKLMSARPSDTLFAVGVDQIEEYDWAPQSITLTADATRNLLAALEPPENLKESVQALNSLRARLGWGNRLDHALYTKGFLVTLSGEVVYGGIFLDATSQRAIRYPVIRAGLSPDGKAQFNLLPVHVSFYSQDPVARTGTRDEAVVTEMAGDWRQFPTEVKALVAGWATTDTAMFLRRLIRSPSIQAVMLRAGKLR